MKKVEAGIMSKWFNLFQKILGPAVDKTIDNIIKNGINIDKVEETEETTESGEEVKGFSFVATTGNNKKLLVKCVPTAGRKDMWDMYVKTKDGKKKSFPQIKQDQIDDKLLKFIEEVYGEDALDAGYKDAMEYEAAQRDAANMNIDESRRIEATFKRVTCGSDAEVHLVSVYANYSPTAAYNDLQAVIQDDEFCNGLTEDPATFEIVPMPDGLEVTPIEAPSLNNCYEQIIMTAYRVLLDVQAIHWNVQSPQFMRIHEMTDDYISDLREQIDELAEIALQAQDCMINPISLIKQCESCVPTGNIAGTEAANILQLSIMEYVNCLEIYYVDVPHDVQSKFDEWIAEWKKSALFKLRRIR